MENIQEDTFAKILKDAFEKVSTYDNIRVSITSFERPLWEYKLWKQFFGASGVAKTEEDFIRVPKREHRGIPIPAQTAYAAMAGNLRSLKKNCSGSWLVYSKIASMDYLWNEIRVLGGAYGAYMNVDEDLNLTMYTYRDPNPGKSLDIFRGVCDFMDAYTKEQADIDRLIIGTIAGTEPLFTPYSMGKKADYWLLCGVTCEMRKMKRSEILHTTVESLSQLTEELRQMLDYMDTSVVASMETLQNLKGEINVKS